MSTPHRVKTKKCRICKKRLPVYRFHKNRSKTDGLRSECCKCAAAMKAEYRRTGPRRPAEPRDGIFYRKIPVERVLPIFKRYMMEHPGITNNTNGSMVRAVHRMENDPNELGFDFVDRWLVEFGLSHLWHVAPENGGLSDFYHSGRPVRFGPTGAARSPSSSERRRAPIQKGRVAA
jgi:hypothetical protein